MSIQSEIIDALEELEGDLNSEAIPSILITPSGAEIPCVSMMEGVGTEIAIGAQIETITLVVHVRKSWFVDASNTVITVDSDLILADNSTGRPKTGAPDYRTGGFRGKKYRVRLVQEDPSGACFKVSFTSAK